MARLTVHRLPCLSVTTLIEKRWLMPGRHLTGMDGYAEPWNVARSPLLIATSDLRDRDAAWMRLTYDVDGGRVSLQIGLTTTAPNYGGLRWWFRCPLRQGPDGLGLRVGKLYLPPHSRWFGSRAAHDLTYRSSQESRQGQGLDRWLAARLGCREKDIRQLRKRPP